MVSCQLYDTIELVCVYHYPVRFKLRSGDIVEGIATDTLRDKVGDECISIKVEGQLINITLKEIKSLKVMVNNLHLDFIAFE